MLGDVRAGCQVCRGSSHTYGRIFNHSRSLPSPVFRPSVDCPRFAWDHVDCVTGEVLRLRGPQCRRKDCSECLAWKAQRVEQALHLVEPRLFLTLGMAGDTPVEVQARMTVFRRRIRTVTEDWQDSYFVEPHRYRSGYHVHLFAHRRVNDDVLRATALRSGFPDGNHIRAKVVRSHNIFDIR